MEAHLNIDDKLISDRMIHLKHIQIGKRKLRYIQLQKSSLLFFNGNQSRKCDDDSMLLFLGCDVLGDTCVSTKNMARQHQRMSSKNYCCRVVFPYRLSGVRGRTNIVWFYDIHGLIQSAFEFYELKEQILFMRCFFQTWSSEEEHNLPSEINLVNENLVNTELHLTVLRDNVNEVCKLCEENKLIQFQFNNTHNIEIKPALKDAFSQTDVDLRQSLHSKSEIFSNTNENSIESTLSDANVTLNFLSSMNQHLQIFYDLASKDIIFYRVYTMLESILFIIQEEMTQIEKSTTGIFPLHLITKYGNIRRENPMQHGKDYQNFYYQECCFKIIGQWLADEFRSFHEAIAKKMEEFKRSQILLNNISINPVQVLNYADLYPHSMIEFLTSWMGHCDVDKKEDDNKIFFYSRLLLVLELLNDTLLTGIGHVVYAKLKCNHSM